MIEEKEMVMVTPTGGDPFHKKAYFLKPIAPHSSIDEQPFELSNSFSRLPSSFHPKTLELNLPGWRCNHQDLQSWFNHLAPKYQSTWKSAGVYEAIISSIYKIKKRKDLLFVLAERWCGETNTFIFPWGEATITLEDVMVLGGFSVFGVSILSPLENRELRELESKLDKERIGLYDHSAGCRTASTYLWMKKFMKSGNELEQEAFLVFWLSRYVFPCNRNLVNKAVFSIAIRLARGVRVALAPAVLAHIYNDLSLLNNTILSANEFAPKNALVKVILKSQVQLVQVWAWERFWELRPKSKVISCGEPRLAQWNDVDGRKVGDMRRVLDSAGEGFIWRPYVMAIKNWNRHKYYVEKAEWFLVGTGLNEELLAFALCLRVAELVGFDTNQDYLPHRVARQFGFDQDLPCSVSGQSHNYQNTKLYIPSRLSEADVTVRYSNWWKESVSSLGQKCMPPKKRAEKDVNAVHDASPCICSPKTSISFLQVSGGWNDGENSLAPPGFSPRRNTMETGDHMDEDDLTISQAMILKKKGTASVNLSPPDQILPSSSVVCESSINIKMSEILENEVELGGIFWTCGGKDPMKLDKVIRSKEKTPSIASTDEDTCPSSTSLMDKPGWGSSTSIFEKQECTSSGSLFGKLECATISPSITGEGTFVNTKKAQRLEKDVQLSEVLISGGKGKRKMRSQAGSSSLCEKAKNGSISPSIEKRVSDLKAKVKRLENVVQVLKENTFGMRQLNES